MGKLTLQDIARELADKDGIELRAANSFASEMFSIIQQRLEADHLVKVKGLGTFKIIDVDARESVSVRTGERVVIDGHSKITFTPDAVIRELVNKPFSQFETVVLNEGVEFDDMADESEETESETETNAPAEYETPAFSQAATMDDGEATPKLIEEAQPVVEEPQPVVEEAQPVVEEAQPVVEEAVAEVNSEKETCKDNNPHAQTVLTTDGTSSQEEEDAEDTKRPATEADSEQTDKSHSWIGWTLGVFGVLAAMAASALGGYYYGKSQTVRAVDTVYVRGTLVMAAPTDSTRHNAVALAPAVQPEEPASEQQALQEQPAKPTVTDQSAMPVTTDQPASPDKQEPQLDQYEQRDERVRLGAYRIVGLDHEVKVLAGQTFYSICKAHLGPDMQCYVEVYNDLPRNPNVKEGQIIRIPKLQWKKRKRR